MSWIKSVAAGIALTLIAGSPAAYGGVVLSPTSSFNNTMGQAGASFAPVNMINQSGLLSPFTSGVTDIVTYVASNPLHSLLTGGGGGNAFASSAAVTSGSIDLDLGAVYSIDSFLIWGDNAVDVVADASPKDFSLTGSLVADFSVSLLLGNFTSAPSAGEMNIPVQTFGFGAATVRYIRFSIQNTHASDAGFSSDINIGEIAFGTSMIQAPEPGTLAILGLGLAGLVFARRRARATVVPAHRTL